VTVDDGDPVAALQPRPPRRGLTVDEESAGNDALPQHLPVHIE